MTKQVLKTIYELEEVKEKAIEKNRFINVDFDDWCEPTIDSWTEKLKDIGFEGVKIYFRVFYSQGDGACFDCNEIDNQKLFDYLLSVGKISEKEFDNLKDVFDWFKFAIETNSFATYYSHEKTRFISLEILDYNYIDEKQEKLLNEIEKTIEEIRLEFCDRIYKDLENEYYYLTSDDSVYETLKTNEFYFESNGEIANI